MAIKRIPIPKDIGNYLRVSGDGKLIWTAKTSVKSPARIGCEACLLYTSDAADES